MLLRALSTLEFPLGWVWIFSRTSQFIVSILKCLVSYSLSDFTRKTDFQQSMSNWTLTLVKDYVIPGLTPPRLIWSLAVLNIIIHFSVYISLHSHTTALVKCKLAVPWNLNDWPESLFLETLKLRVAVSSFKTNKQRPYLLMYCLYCLLLLLCNYSRKIISSKNSLECL